MKILHVYKDYFPVLGGIENHIRLLAEAQAAAGHDVTVLTTNLTLKSTILEANGVRVIKAGRLWQVASTPFSFALPRFLAREHPDIAHLQFPYPVGEISHYFFGHAMRTVITYQSDVVRQKRLLQLYLPLLWRVLRRADGIIATSPQYAASSSILSQLADKVTVIPLGIDPAPFLAASPEEGKQIRQAYLPTADTPCLLFTGKLRYYKGVDTLLRALVDLPGVYLLIVGNGPMQQKWEALAAQLDLRGRVHFVGEVLDADLPSFYRAADIFVLPSNSRAEAFGLVQLEAMASGLPVISTAVGSGTSFVNRHGETGLVVPPGRPEALVEAIQSLLADPARRRAMGDAGRERLLAHFTVEQMVAAISSFYESLLA